MEYSHLEYYLKTGKYHPKTPDYKKRGIRKASHNFVLKGATLVYVGKGRMQIVCRDDEDKRNAILWCHNNRQNQQEPCSVRDTIKMLQKTYYWHGLNKDIEKRLYPCSICTANTSQSSSNSLIPSLPQPIVSRPLHIAKSEVRDEDFIDQPSRAYFQAVESSEQASDNENSLQPCNDRNEDTPYRSLVDAYSSFTAVNSRLHNNAIELLLERISQLESINAVLQDENETLKEKIKSLHTTLENQRNLPILEDMINQLKQTITQASCSRET